MTAVRSGRPGLLVLLILSAAFILVSRCRTTDLLSIPRPAANPCMVNPTPPSNGNSPIVCVDDRNFPTLKVSPYDAEAYRGKTILWWTVSGTGTLSIAFKKTNPVGYVTCWSGSGHCRATVPGSAPYDKYPYTATLTNNEGQVGSIDPTIIIDTD